MREYLVSIVAAALTSCAFALIFHINKYKILLVSLGGALNWFVYLMSIEHGNGRILSFFIATSAAALFAEVSARLVKAPVITLIAPMLIPMVPGSDLYYTTFALVRGNMEEFASFGTRLIFEMGAMSLGIILVACLMQIYTRIRLTIRKRNR